MQTLDAFYPMAATKKSAIYHRLGAPKMIIAGLLLDFRRH